MGVANSWVVVNDRVARDVEPMVGLAVRLRALSASKDITRVAIEAVHAQGRRALVSRGWADLVLGKAVSVRVNHAGWSSQDPQNTRTSKPW